MSGILLVELGDESEDSTCTSWNNKGEELLVKMLSLLDVHACCCAKEGLIKGSIVWVESFTAFWRKHFCYLERKTPKSFEHNAYSVCNLMMEGCMPINS